MPREFLLRVRGPRMEEQAGDCTDLMMSKGEGPVPQPQARRRLAVETLEGIILVRFTASRFVPEEDVQAAFEQLQRVLDGQRGRDLCSTSGRYRSSPALSWAG